MEKYRQLSFIQSEFEPADPRSPITTMWNVWHGCTRVSPGCDHCYMYRKDQSVGRDPTLISRTGNFNLPVRRLRAGKYKGSYKVPSGSLFYTCFSSDFFHKEADQWRDQAWDMMRKRSDCVFFMITKRPERIGDHLPPDWGNGWGHVQIAVTCENQWAADRRLPIYLNLPLMHRAVMVEPMLSSVDLRTYFQDYPRQIESVSAGGESGPEARPCDYQWVLDLQRQCVDHGVGFSYHQTGARLIKDGKTYNIPRRFQHDQAKKAGLDL